MKRAAPRARTERNRARGEKADRQPGAARNRGDGAAAGMASQETAGEIADGSRSLQSGSGVLLYIADISA